MRLSLALGIPRSELRARLTPEDWTFYLAFMAVEPLGEERADLRNALLCHVLTALHAKKPVAVADFLPRWWKRSESTEGGSDGG